MVGAAQAERGRGDRGEEGHHALVAAHDQEPASRRSPARPRRAAMSSTPSAADLAEQAVADDHEQDDEHRDVEQPLGEQRADHGALRGRRRAAPSGRRGWRRPRARAGRCCPCSRCTLSAYVSARAGVAPSSRAAAASARRARRWPARRADRAEQRADLPAARGSSRRLLLQRPPDDAGEATSEMARPSQVRREPRRRRAAVARRGPWGGGGRPFGRWRRGSDRQTGRDDGNRAPTATLARHAR